MVAYQYLYLHRSTLLQFQLEFSQFQFPFYVISCISSVVLWSRGLIALFVQVPVELYTYVCMLVMLMMMMMYVFL